MTTPPAPKYIYDVPYLPLIFGTTTVLTKGLQISKQLHQNELLKSKNSPSYDSTLDGKMLNDLRELIRADVELNLTDASRLEHQTAHTMNAARNACAILEDLVDKRQLLRINLLGIEQFALKRSGEVSQISLTHPLTHSLSHSVEPLLN